ncbi:MAG: flagellar hook-length control protein FliK [Polaromonas sp.]
MSGLTPLVDTLLATRLAQRVDLVPLKPELEIAGPGAVTQVEKVTNDIRLPSRAALQQQLGVGLLKSDQRGHLNAPARPGETVSLSLAARAVSAILDIQAGATAKIIGAEPLLPHSQPPQPPLPHLLSATLARTVANSGLFYESHLAQYAAGTRTLAELAQEPQARLDTTIKAAVEAFTADAAGQDSGVSTPNNGRSVEVGRLPVAVAVAPVPVETGEGMGVNSVNTGFPHALNPLPAGPAVSAEPTHLAASGNESRLREYGSGSIQDAAEQDGAGKDHGASTPDASRSNAPGLAGIHPEAVALVRQQLELLAVPVFRWAGEAWPGTPMDWEIHEERDEREAAAEMQAHPRTWSTRLALTLPTLRDVEVRISLAGNKLQVHLAARENATLALFNEGRHELPKRLGDMGLQLAGLQIATLPENPAVQGSSKDGDGE